MGSAVISSRNQHIDSCRGVVGGPPRPAAVAAPSPPPPPSVPPPPTKLEDRPAGRGLLTKSSADRPQPRQESAADRSPFPAPTVLDPDVDATPLARKFGVGLLGVGLLSLFLPAFGLQLRAFNRLGDVQPFISVAMAVFGGCLLLYSFRGRLF